MEELNSDIQIHNLKIGDKAPRFIADSTDGEIKLSDYIGNWLIFFSHPGDYTPVCTTEFIEFTKLTHEFKKRNCSLLGLSIDSVPSHISWLKNIYDKMGILISFPVIADRNMEISQKYGMIAPNVSETETIRSVYIIDPNQIIRAILQYPKTCGRNMLELLRILDSLILTDKEKIVTPANWIPGKSTIKPSQNTFKEIIKEKNHFEETNCLDWYLCYNRQFDKYKYKFK